MYVVMDVTFNLFKYFLHYNLYQKFYIVLHNNITCGEFGGFGVEMRMRERDGEWRWVVEAAMKWDQ